MPSLNSDVFYVLANELVALYRSSDDPTTIISLSSTCRVLRQSYLPVLFQQVHWPHPNKHDDQSGLHFFPPQLWPYFKRFQLIWPDDWPDANPPRWGDRYYIGGDYHPRYINKLVAALPKMSSLNSFYLSCPFYPPSSILNALIHCPSLRDLSIHDTPLYLSMIPTIPPTFHLDRLSLVPVAEAVRVGEGPYDPRYSEVSYYIREYRKKYKNDILARYAAPAFLFQVGKTASLRHVQVSTDLCGLDALADHDWPSLHSLVLTGHTPRGAAELVDVVARMPQLRELSLLFAKTKGDARFRILPDLLPTPKKNHPRVLAQLARLAVSNACNFDQVFYYTTALERLAICAIIDQPRVPIALSRSDIDKVLQDMEVGARTAESRLARLRIMIEDKVNPELCRAIAAHCPNLTALEIELCGYHDGKSIYAWSEFADAFAPLTRLHDLRICIQFPEYDETDPFEPWRAARRECAAFLAQRIATLGRVGFEYRKRTGTHRFEDSWLEFEVERRGGAGGGGGAVGGGGTGGQGGGAGGEGTGTGGEGRVELFELGPSWYPFPEVWCAVPVGR